MKKVFSAAAAAVIFIGPSLAGSTVELHHLGGVISECWNTGSLDQDALNSTVVVEFTVDSAGKIDLGSISPRSSNSPSSAATRQAFEAARRALIRCLAGETLDPVLRSTTLLASFSAEQGVLVGFPPNLLIEV